MGFSMISILKAELSTFDLSPTGDFPFQLRVTIQLSAKEYNNAKRKGTLGFIYSRDASNALYQLTQGKMPHCTPEVIREHRTKDAAKNVDLRFLFSDADRARAMGMPGTFLKFEGKTTFNPAYSVSVNLLESL